MRRRRRTREAFYRNPSGFTKSLFQQAKSGRLAASKEEVEAHLQAVYSDPRKEEPLDPIEGITCPSEPGEEFNMKPMSFREISEVV